MSGTTRRRLDQEMVRRGLVVSRRQALDAVRRGRVLVSGVVADKGARLVSPAEPVVLQGDPPRFVGRGGRKLEAALEGLGVDVAGRTAFDAGASTGGFTDCLLQRGAAHVHAVDVGFGQLDARLRSDPRVRVHERVNVRWLAPEDLSGSWGEFRPVDVVVADLSFISLTVVAPVLAGPVVRDGGDLVLLVKPQFEVGRRAASRGRGVVHDPDLWRQSLERVARSLVDAGAGIMGAMTSPILGSAGNTEFFVHARARAEHVADRTMAALLDQAVLAASPLDGERLDPALAGLPPDGAADATGGR